MTNNAQPISTSGDGLKVRECIACSGDGEEDCNCGVGPPHRKRCENCDGAGIIVTGGMVD